MPLFAGLVGTIASALVTFFARFMGFKLALKLAAFTTWLGIFTALLGTVYVCISSLYAGAAALFGGGGVGGAGWLTYFGMALGMFIPGNAGAVMSCIGSVWIATGIYKFQKDAIHTFGH